jgi:phosphinothricin acetyltransferase
MSRDETPVVLRNARASDAAGLLEIYRPYVLETAVSFETTPPTLEEFVIRIEQAASSYAWVTASVDNQFVGYAYATAHRDRPAYRYSVETSVYVAPAHQRQGIGKRLYGVLLAELRLRGFGNAFAGMTLPNPGSEALHRRVGFTPVGTFPRVGHKFGAWHDVAWMHLPLQLDPRAVPA